MLSPSVCFISAILSYVPPGSSHAFLEQTISRGAQYERVEQTSVESILLAEVRAFTEKGQMDTLLPEIQTALEPMWRSLPKNEQGNLGHFEVRYALRRVFVQRHGWQLDGLDNIGKDGEEASAIGLLRGRVPAFLMDRFQEAFGASGLKLHELAILAATLEHIIHDEATTRLSDLYHLLSLSTDSKLSEEQAIEVLEGFAMSLIRGSKRILSKSQLRTYLSRIPLSYPGWVDTQLWLQDLFRTANHLERTNLNAFVGYRWSFAHVERVAQQISYQFGRFQNADCSRLKNNLLEVEDGLTGRVRLSAFYKRFFETSSVFKESAESLREMGALDDRGSEPRVIVSNYVLAPSNCLADTGFYSICCINECEDVMATVERVVGAPHAPPDDIVAIVSKVSTSTVEGTGTLADGLVERLMVVAQRHGGQVPLHGRLFAQWLHAAFPRECPYPHTSGSVNTTTATAYAALPESLLTEKSMEQYIEKVSSSTTEDDTQDEVTLDWQHVEELLYKPGEQPRIAGSRAAFWVWSIMTVGGVGCFMFVAADLARRFIPERLGDAGKPHLV